MWFIRVCFLASNYQVFAGAAFSISSLMTPTEDNLGDLHTRNTTLFCHQFGLSLLNTELIFSVSELVGFFPLSFVNNLTGLRLLSRVYFPNKVYL